MSEAMVEEKVLGIADLEANNGVQFKYISVPRLNGKLRIGSLSTQDMMDWVEANQSAKRTAGLRLIVKSLVDENDVRVGKDSLLDTLRKLDAKTTRAILQEILDFNGLTADKEEETKNASSEA